MRDGDCYLSYIQFSEQHGGKKRPVIIICDSESDRYYACKVTGKVNNPKNKRYGYQIEDWKSAGLHQPSIIKCNRSEIYEVDPSSFRERIGSLSEKDLKGLLAKQIKVRLYEQQKERGMTYQ